LPCVAGDAEPVLDAWLKAQAELKTWTAESRQTRALKTLATPLVSTGRVWFAAPDRFRWELGQPAQTVAVRNGEQMWVVYPRLKRAERYDLRVGRTGPWRDALALLEAGFPRNRATLDQQFRLLSTLPGNQTQVLNFQPMSASARRFITEVRVTLATNPVTLAATELVFADGSRMRNDFSSGEINPALDPALFDPPIPPDFTVTEPLKP
jgi:outer membrane lipoprotein-sorting protein